jgi:hypothetical protein
MILNSSVYHGFAEFILPSLPKLFNFVAFAILVIFANHL